MTPAQRAEARTAARVARQRHPSLMWDGFHDAPRADADDSEIFLLQVVTSLAYLRVCPPTKPISSYVLKHEAERWGQAHGMSPYVPGGALLTAAIYLGLRLGRQRGLHTDIGPARRERAA